MRKRTGTVEYVTARRGERQGHYRARITLWDGGRTPWIALKPSPRSEQAEKRARETAAAWTEQAQAQGLGWVPPEPEQAQARGRAKPAADMAVWFDKWIADREARGYTSTRENGAHYREHVAPVLPGHVRDWTPDDLRALSCALDDKVQGGSLAWKTAGNVWGTVTKMSKDASASKVEALRVRKDNPAAGVQGPDGGAAKQKQYLYPSEFIAFVSCEKVPLAWRRVVALAVYLFPRAGELRVLDWGDVDLEHGTVHIHQAADRATGKVKTTKTGEARRFSVEPAILPLLRALHDERRGAGLVTALSNEHNMARGLRRWLLEAGVKRAELHETTPTRKAMTFHDLRATGLTWMAVRGDDPLKIMQRAGHTDFKTTQGYIREAENVRDAFGDVFAELPGSLLKASATQPAVTVPWHPIVQAKSPCAAKYAEALRRGRDSNPR